MEGIRSIAISHGSHHHFLFNVDSTADQRFLPPRCAAARFAGGRFLPRAPGGLITLWIGITLGGTGSGPNCTGAKCGA
ncbi:MAG: hypothetical protein ACYDAH_02170 [Steroidobacteraceae bacterium]